MEGEADRIEEGGGGGDVARTDFTVVKDGLNKGLTGI